MTVWIGDMKYGSIEIEGKTYHHDIILHRNGVGSKIKECQNAVCMISNPSKEITLEKVKSLWSKGLKWLIIGTGIFDKPRATPEAIEFLITNGCKVSVVPTQKAVTIWNRSKGNAVGIFHLVP